MPHLTSSAGQIAHELRDLIARVYEDLAESGTQASIEENEVGLLAALLGMRPALLAPETGARSLLEHPQLRLTKGLHELRKAILAYVRPGLALNPHLLRGVRQIAAWEAEAERLQDEASVWLTSNRQRTIIYAATTDVWRRWLHDEGPIGSTFLAIGLGPERADAVSRFVKEWSDRSFVLAQLARTDKEIRGTRAKRKPIEARAQTAAWKHSQEAVEIARRWLDLIEDQPHHRDDFRHKQADKLRGRALKAIQSAQEELAGRDIASLPAAAAASAGQRALQDLHALFEPDTRDPIVPLPVHMLLHGDLLRVGFSTGSEWEPLAWDEEFLQRIADAATNLDKGWEAIFEELCERGDHAATGRLLDLLEAREGDPELVDRLRKYRESILSEQRIELEFDLDKARLEVERGLTRDLLPEGDRLSMVRSLERIRPGEAVNIAAARETIAAVRERIQRSHSERLARVRARLEGIARDRPAVDLERVERAVDRGDFRIADELLDRLAAGELMEAPADDRPDHLTQFFPEFSRSLESLLEPPSGTQPEIPALIEQISKGHSVGPLDMRQVPGAQAKVAADLLREWYRAKARRGSLEDSVQIILQALGFQVARLRPLRSRGGKRQWWADVRTAPIGERAVCPIPAYGSLAEGRYSVLAVWGRPSEEEVVEFASSAGRQEAVIVFYFGRLTEARRRDLAHLCRTRGRSLLVLDESLIFYLCTARGLRLPVFFATAFPFTVANPYNTTASLVPREMFFGRVREREAIIGRFGTSFIYGGRQLGKTALLRDVERRYHDPEAGTVVIWTDLKVEGIAVSRSTEDIWSLIARLFSEHNVIPSAQVTPETLAKRTAEWLSADQGRRIVLLLDEADAFLESDGRHGYTNVGRLKGLSDATDRRFKVVFAGLHNVQRTARDPNTPLAHLGTPICIGPLIDHGEWREAMALVQQPLETLGYRFESDELPLRTVAQANYYPSLIQLFCKHLLDRLGNPNLTTFDPRNSPPYVVTSAHVEEADDRELRQHILDRFRWTLDLDPRYRVIALAFGLEEVASAEECSDDAQDQDEGFDIEWVRNEALTWWEEGFRKDPSLEGFRTILDEMVGLGVLRHVEGSRYALRSPNVVNLLGTRDQIERALLEAGEQAVTPEYSPDTFRRFWSEDGWERSPLTASQEARILKRENGAVLIFGTRAAGLDDLERFLRLACEKAGGKAPIALDPDHNLRRLLHRIDQVAQATSEGLSVVVVPAVCPWDRHWVSEASRRLRRKTSRARFIRVVFVGDSRSAWSWIGAGPSDSPGETDHTTVCCALHPWSEDAIQRWMQDAKVGPHGDKDGPARFRAATGGWGALLTEIGRRCRESPWQWEKHLDSLKDDIVTESRWKEMFGIVAPAVPVLHMLAELGEPVASDDLTALLDLTPETTTVDTTIRWGDLLGLIRKVDRIRWEIDPIVARLASTPTP